MWTGFGAQEELSKGFAIVCDNEFNIPELFRVTKSIESNERLGDKVFRR